MSDVPLFNARPGSLYRSDDDAASWTNVFTADPVGGSAQPYIDALTMDPNAPDQVYAASRCAGCGVMASADGGLTWTSLGTTDVGRVRGLGLNPDGQTLFAATEQGVWRLNLAP